MKVERKGKSEQIEGVLGRCHRTGRPLACELGGNRIRERRFSDFLLEWPQRWGTDGLVLPRGRT